ncbi:carbohydrate ABC transporter permease, partial [Rhodococcus rhodnii]
MALVLLDPPGGAPAETGGDAAESVATSAPRGRVRVFPARRATGHLVLAVVALVSVFPVYWMYTTAFRGPEDALSASPIPWPLSLDNFRYVFDTIPISAMMLNTFGMALVLTVSQMLVAVLASYAFARWQFFGKNVLFMIFVGSWLVPFQVTMIPNYLLISQIGLLDTIAGVVLPNLCSAFGVLMLRQHMEAFPRELLDASEMDGQGSWAALWKVVVP